MKIQQKFAYNLFYLFGVRRFFALYFVCADFTICTNATIKSMSAINWSTFVCNYNQWQSKKLTSTVKLCLFESNIPLAQQKNRFESLDYMGKKKTLEI